MGRMKRLFSAWRGGSAERGARPAPDSSQPMRVDAPGEKLVDIVTSATGDVRVGITRDRAGLFRLRVETWAPDWDSLGVATWLQRGDQADVADSLDRARSMAAELLAEAGLEGGEP